GRGYAPNPGPIDRMPGPGRWTARRLLTYDWTVSVEELRVSQSSSQKRARPWLMRHPAAPVIGVWVVAATAMSQVAGQVKDWFDMTDELRYERLAISIARTGSPLPRIHETAVRDLDQLYPLLIAPFFRNGTIAFDLHQAHVLDAWVMTSACIPAFLLARRV